MRINIERLSSSQKLAKILNLSLKNEGQIEVSQQNKNQIFCIRKVKQELKDRNQESTNEKFNLDKLRN